MRHELCLFGAALMLVACQPSTKSTPSTGVAPSATIAGDAPLTIPLVDPTWIEVDRPDADPTWGARGLLADAEGFLVYGAVGDQLMTWSSVDGRAWNSKELVSFDDTPSKAAASANVTILLAVIGTGHCAHPVGEALWRRIVGQPDWAVVPFDEDLFCAGGIPQIAASNDVFVVAGVGTGEQPFAWRSIDGLHWFDVSNGLTFDAPPALLASTPDGFIEVGRGSITDVRLLGDAGWTAIAPPPEPPAFDGVEAGFEPAVLLSTEAGVFVLFQDEDPPRLSGWLRGSDGAWTRTGTAGLPLGFVQGGTTIDGVPYLYVFDGQLTHLMGSADLQSWIAVSTPKLSQIGAVAIFGDRVLLWGDKDPPGMGLGNPGFFIADLPPQ